MQESFSHQPGRAFSYPGPGAFAPDSVDRKLFRSASDAEMSLREERERRRQAQRFLEKERDIATRGETSVTETPFSPRNGGLDALSADLDRLDQLPRRESMRHPHRYNAPKPKAEVVPVETVEERRLRFKREMRLLAQNYAHTNPDSRDFRYEVEGDLRAQRDREWMSHDRGAILPSRERFSGRYPEQQPRRQELEDRERLARWNAHLVENTPDTFEYDADRELEAFLIERARERRRT